MLLRILSIGLVLLGARPSEAQNWVQGINPGMVRPPVTAVVPTRPVIVQHAPIVVVQPGPVVVLTHPSPGSRVGPGHDRPEPKPPLVSTPPAPVFVYPAATGVNAYVYQGAGPYLVGPGGGAVYSGIVPATGVGAGIAGRGPHSGPRSEIQATSPGGISIGTPRADVLRILGRPHAAIYRSSGRETLIFTGTTVFIQNGVVAVIQ
jgi:hypothetical protein